jgi:hypothetical protein
LTAFAQLVGKLASVAWFTELEVVRYMASLLLFHPSPGTLPHLFSVDLFVPRGVESWMQVADFDLSLFSSFGSSQ